MKQELILKAHIMAANHNHLVSIMNRVEQSKKEAALKEKGQGA